MSAKKPPVKEAKVGKMSQDKPRVSVLMPTYNRPGYIKDAIKSVLAQTLTDFELIIMNDGGVDVGYIIEEFDDPRIRYFNDEVNKGKCHRLNFGLEKARGDYICYLDDDDIYYPHHCQVLVEALEENPQAQAAYSDLYATMFIKEEVTGKRYPLSKFVQVSRDYNRNFMLYYNHTLHVSLMHTKQIAERVGGYNEDVRVLIDWNITRKMSYYTDFIYVPQVTGEYYMPISNSDRISSVQRKNQESYNHNLRKIKSDLPPEPWVYIEKIGIVVPVEDWEDINGFLSNLYDKTIYPFRLYLVDRTGAHDEEFCREKLGKFSDFFNITVLAPGRKLSDLACYHHAALNSRDRYLYLGATNLNLELRTRLLSSLELYQETSPAADAVRLNDGSPVKGLANLFLERETFLARYSPEADRLDCTMKVAAPKPPQGMGFDVLFQEAKKALAKEDYKKAEEFLEKAASFPSGIPGEQFLNSYRTPLFIKLKKYPEAERRCLALIERGYQADNYVYLGDIYLAQGKHQKALSAYQRALRQIGLRESDLSSPVFPIVYSGQFKSFDALIGLGEAQLALGDHIRAAKTFHRAARTKANSHRPVLGFAKIFLAEGDVEKAKTALAKAHTLGRDPELNRVVGRLALLEGKPHLALKSFLAAYDQDRHDPGTIDLIYQTGKQLKQWETMAKVFEHHLAEHPARLKAIGYLAEVRLETGEFEKAEQLVRRGLALDRYDEELLNLDFRLRRRATFAFGPEAKAAGAV